MEEELTYGEIRKRFLNNYREIFVPFTKNIERRKFNTKSGKITFYTTRFLGIIAVIFFILIFLLMMLPEGVCQNILFAAFILVCFFITLPCYMSWNTISKAEEALQYKNCLKRAIMPKLLECLELNWSQGKTDIQILENVGIHLNETKFVEENGTEYIFEVYDDIIKGSRNGVEFEIIERRLKAYDNGYLILYLALNKQFKSKTIIKGKNCIIKNYTKKPETVYEVVSGNITDDNGLMETTLEDIVFEKDFNVYTNDEIEARYLITPSFMERINTLKRAFDGELNGCIFNDNKLFIILNTKKDLFEPFILNSPNEDATQFFGMVEEIISVYRLIDYLKLNLKIGI